MRFAKQRVFIVVLFLALPVAASLAFIQTPLVSDFVLRFALTVVRFRTHLKVDARTWDVSPFVFSATLEGVSLDQDGVKLRVPRLSIQLSPLSLLFGQIHLRKLYLGQPEVVGRLPPTSNDESATQVELPSDVPTWLGRHLAATMGELGRRHLYFDDLEIEGLRVDLDRVRAEGMDLRLSNLDLGQARAQLAVRGLEVPGRWSRIEEISLQATLLRESAKTFYLALSNTLVRLNSAEQSTRFEVEGRWPGRLRGTASVDLAELKEFGKGSPDAPADFLLSRGGRLDVEFEGETGKAKLQNLSATFAGRNLAYDDFRVQGLATRVRIDLSGPSAGVHVRDLELELPAAKNDRAVTGGRLKAKELVVENSRLRGKLLLENASVCSIQEASGTPDCFSASTASGSMDIDGSLDPFELKVLLDLQTSRVHVGGEPFSQVATVKADVLDPGVTTVIRPAHMVGTLIVRPKYLLLSPTELQWPDGSAMRAEGRIDYKPTVLDILATTETARMETIVEKLADLDWQGKIRSEARVQYSMNIPKEAGRTQVFARAQIQDFGLQGQVFGDINGPFIFTGDTLRIGALQLKAGGGSGRLDGFLKMPANAPSRLQLNGVFERIELTSTSSETGREIFRGFVSGTGSLDGGLDANAPESFLAGNLALRADSFRFYGFPLQSATAQARYEKSRLLIKSIQARKGDSVVDVEGVLDPKGGSELRFKAQDLVVRDMDLAPGLSVLEGGKARFEGKWQPSKGWALEGRLGGVRIAGRTLPEGPLYVGGDNESFRVKVSLPGAITTDYESRDGKNGVPASTRLKASVHDDGVYALFAYLEGWTNPQPIDVKGGIEVDVRADRGAVTTDGMEISGSRRVDGTRVTLLKLEGGQRLAWSGNQLEQLSFQSSEPTQFRLVGARGDDRVRIEGEIPMAFIDLFVPSLRLSNGSLRVDGQIPLPPSFATLRAKAKVQNGDLLIEGIDETVTDLSGDLEFRDNQIFIDQGSGRLGGGSVSFSGAYKLDDSKSGISLRAKLNRAHVIVLDDIPMDATGELVLTGEDFPWLLSGQLSTINGLYTKPFNGEESTEVRRDPRLRFDLDIEVGANMVVRNELVSSPIQGRLHLAGTDQDPLLQGRIVMGSGVIYANENEFRIAQGNVSFTGAPGNIPLVNLEASTTVRANSQPYRIQISASGPGDALSFGFSSEPSLPTSDIVNLLAFGIIRPAESAADISTDSNIGNAAQWQALQMLFGKSLGKNLDRTTGVQLRVQTSQSKSQTTEAIPKITAQKKLTDRVSVVAGRSLDQRQPEKDVQIDYRLFNNVNLSGVWENPKPEQSSVGVDLRFRFDIK